MIKIQKFKLNLKFKIHQIKNLNWIKKIEIYVEFKNEILKLYA